MTIKLQIHVAHFSYGNGPVLSDINLVLNDGEMTGLIGPNGSGKTTLLKLASGILRPEQGDVKLDGISLNRLSRSVIARGVAVVPQYFESPFSFTVEEVVMLGRTPYHRAFTREIGRDSEVVSYAMGLFSISHLGQRRFDELSGGERQKVILAMALAQEPNLLLLDEPTVHLDIAHQVEILEQIKAMNSDKGLTVLAVMHDLNLAACYFDRLILLKEGKILASGTPAEVLTEVRIKDAFAAEVKVEPHSPSGAPHVFVIPRGNTARES